MSTPKLMSASKDDDVATVTRLLAQGLSPDLANGIGQTSLHVAAIWGNVAVARVLLDAGASINVANQFGATPLHFAAQNKRVEMAKLLLEYGADTQARGGNGHCTELSAPRISSFCGLSCMRGTPERR